jgi:hypothetical protein
MDDGGPAESAMKTYKQDPAVAQRIRLRRRIARLLCLAAAGMLLFLDVHGADPNPQRSSRRGSTPGQTTTQPATNGEADENTTSPQEDEEQLRVAEREAQRLRARLTRGPYLQLGTPESMVVRWRTEGPSPSSIRFGLSPTHLKFVARSPGASTEHVVLLTNLQPETRYFYAFSTNTLNGTNQLLIAGTNSFVTAPLRGAVKPIRAWVLGDPGTRKPLQAAVKQGFFKWNGDRPVDLWLMLGDNAYTAGRDAEYQSGIFLAYPELLRTSVLWPAFGNHDGGSADSAMQSGIYYDTFTLPTLGQAGGVMSGTEAYYSFDYANVHFICLDSTDSDRSTNGLMMRWLKLDLASNTQQWTVAFWHHPPHSKGSHDTDKEREGDFRCRQMRENFGPVLEAGGVDVVLSGHSHAYERSGFIDGLYGGSTNLTTSMFRSFGNGQPDEDGPYRKFSLRPVPRQGTVYIVAGSSGQISGIRDVHPIMQVALNIGGSLAIDVNGPRMDVTFVDSFGNSRDTFSIVKSSGKPETDSLTPAELPPLDAKAAPPARLASLLNLGDSFSFAALTNVIRSDQDFLWERYTNSDHFVEKQRLTWALAAIGDGRIVSSFMSALTNKIRDRRITPQEESERLVIVQALGLLAQHYEPPLDLLKKGISADWWYFRTNFVAARPLHETAAALASCSIQALGLSGRPEAQIALQKAMKAGTKYWVDETTDFTRELRPEFDEASNRIARATQMGLNGWRRQVLSTEIPKLKMGEPAAPVSGDR